MYKLLGLAGNYVVTCCNDQFSSVIGWFAVRHSTLILPSNFPSHSQGVGVLCSHNTVIPPETVLESLVQVTLVAGPPVEIQVRMN